MHRPARMRATGKPLSQNPKSVYRRIWYARRRAALIALLGNCCASCGETEFLQFDHADTRDWDVRGVHSTKRLRIYAEEIRAGKIQLLCISCNSSKQDATETEVPF